MREEELFAADIADLERLASFVGAQRTTRYQRDSKLYRRALVHSVLRAIKRNARRATNKMRNQ